MNVLEEHVRYGSHCAMGSRVGKQPQAARWLAAKGGKMREDATLWKYRSLSSVYTSSGLNTVPVPTLQGFTVILFKEKKKKKKALWTCRCHLD